MCQIGPCYIVGHVQMYKKKSWYCREFQDESNGILSLFLDKRFSTPLVLAIFAQSIRECEYYF